MQNPEFFTVIVQLHLSRLLARLHMSRLCGHKNPSLKGHVRDPRMTYLP